MTSLKTDVLIIGGGLTGCALASRVKEGCPTLTVTIVEAGPNSTGDPRTIDPIGGFELAMSELDWAYMTVPQRNTNNRSHYNAAGKTLGGGSVLNYGGWSRGDATDYDDWARRAGDKRWSYEGLLPYFRKSEHHLNPEYDGFQTEQHGFEGPLKIASISRSDAGRKYGLREPIRSAFSELRIPFNPDANSGHVLGLAEVDENWDDGVRQPSHLAYSLKGVEVITDTVVARIKFSDDSGYKASGVVLADGRQITVKREVIISAGAHRTPQILMLSGIGPTVELSKNGIPTISELPEVGANMFDHYALFQWWNLHHPDMALGSPKWTLPSLFKGLPNDWVVREHIAEADRDQALKSDKVDSLSTTALSNPARPHVETLLIYAAGPSEAVGLNLPVDGTAAMSSVMLTVPTSRGRISLASADINDKPIVDPNYYDTAFDRACLIYGTRRIMQALLETKAGKEVIDSEIVPPGAAPLNARSTDHEIDARIRAVGMPHAHAAGSAAMGKVVDTKLRVFSVQGLRVADASVFPVPISGHPQATLYALAELAADLILEDLQ
ncbi:MAG: hypothetical protein Q9227_008496 [Pyrenula ochraceoflavens]